ncbi:MAG: hypothetical protein H0X72_19710 [Acidobacteria bacterium]|jgi:hypothetical protein|nr:hypothetical protein [Acidobacteriota bacterium]
MFIFLLFILYVAACRSESFVAVNQETANQGAISISNSSNTAKAAIDSPPTKTASYGEITNCAPEKFGRGTKLVISLKTPNGGYLAIEHEGKNPDYFLLSEPDNSEEQRFSAAADALPFWTTTALKTLHRIELDSSEARAVNLSKLNNQGEGKAELIFNQTGWYKILLSDENFEQDDPVITGQCRVFYNSSASPQKYPETKNTTGNNLIKWNNKTKSLNFETQLAVENDQPTAFLINGSRIVIRGGEKSANECSFGVEKDKNNSVWQTVGNKTFISGKNDSGTDFKMFIEKTDKGFLIDTSAATESCFNVGMPGNILLFKEGNKYTGKFIAIVSKAIVSK